jgi:hypothetical protein
VAPHAAVVGGVEAEVGHPQPLVERGRGAGRLGRERGRVLAQAPRDRRQVFAGAGQDAVEQRPDDPDGQCSRIAASS